MNFILCMKKLITLGCFLGTFLLLLLLGGSNVSCNKPTDCKVVITVIDTAGGLQTPVANATVKLSCQACPTNSAGNISGTGTTNGSGVVDFDFQLPAIFDIAATGTVTVPIPGTVTGSGLVQLQIGETVSQTVYVH
jgi:hypothetical protein